MRQRKDGKRLAYAHRKPVKGRYRPSHEHDGSAIGWIYLNTDSLRVDPVAEAALNKMLRPYWDSL